MYIMFSSKPLHLTAHTVYTLDPGAAPLIENGDLIMRLWFSIDAATSRSQL